MFGEHLNFSVILNKSTSAEPGQRLMSITTSGCLNCEGNLCSRHQIVLPL